MCALGAGCILPQDLTTEKTLTKLDPPRFVREKIVPGDDKPAVLTFGLSANPPCHIPLEVQRIRSADAAANLEARWWIDYVDNNSAVAAPRHFNTLPGSHDPLAIERNGPTFDIDVGLLGNVAGATHVVELILAHENAWDPKFPGTRALLIPDDAVSFRWVINVTSGSECGVGAAP